MIPVPTGVRVCLATGHTDTRRAFPRLALLVLRRRLILRLTLAAVPFEHLVDPGLGDLRHGGVTGRPRMESILRETRSHEFLRCRS